MINLDKEIVLAINPNAVCIAYTDEGGLYFAIEGPRSLLSNNFGFRRDDQYQFSWGYTEEEAWKKFSDQIQWEALKKLES